jgi:hypothetical protein
MIELWKRIEMEEESRNGRRKASWTFNSSKTSTLY